MTGTELLVLAVVVSAMVITVNGGGGGGGFPASVFTLERISPVNQKVELEELKARDRARHARSLQSFAGGIADFSVAGTSDPYIGGLYYTRVKLGSPPREFNVQIDTGSDILWVSCNSCNDCPQSSGLGVELAFFSAAGSSTASLVSCSDALCASMVQTALAECSTQGSQCGYSLQYADGSGTAGYFVSDLFYFDTILGASLIPNSSAPIVFGCSTTLYGDLTKSDRAIDGIFGFGQRQISAIAQLSARGITPKVFSHCLKGGDSGGGILVLGEILDPSIVYTPLVPSQQHYNLYLQSIAVNGQSLSIDNQGTIIDSGTTLAYLVREAYDPFVDAITAAVSTSARPTISRGSQCYLLFNSTREIFPPVSLNFAGGASMILRPADYLVHSGFVEGAAMWCIGFSRVDQGMSILGDLVLKDKIFVYDIAHQRIGWADHDCSLSMNVSITSGKDEFVNAGQYREASSSSCVLRNLPPTGTNAFLLQILTLLGSLFL